MKAPLTSAANQEVIMRTPLSPLLLAASLVGVPMARAQDHDHAAGDAQAIGQVTFDTSCAANVAEEFNSAVAMLHSFWYPASEKAFQAIAEKEPDCAMAHWGVAMSRFHPLWERPGPEDIRVGQAALDKAQAAGAATDRERGYIEALQQFYENADQVDHLDRLIAYEKAMGELHARYPNDSEAAVFRALAILGVAYSSPPDETYARQLEAGAILNPILAAQPDHPGVAHYIIHSHDYPELVDRALEAARRYAEIAPDAPHALHMPSHIFTRLGLWDESIASNRAASASARKDDWIGEELHTLDYLTYAHLQRGEEQEARAILETLPAIEAGAPNYFAGLYATAAIPARFAVERRQWSEAAKLDVPADVFPGGSFCWAEATLYYARGLGAARTGQLDLAHRSIADLEACKAALLDGGEPLWADQVEVQRRAVAASVAWAEGDKDGALTMMRSAADLEDTTDKHPVTPGAIVPARELLGEMLLEIGEPVEAHEAFAATLAMSPNRMRALEGAAQAAERVAEVD